jgi:hypothetical protein
LDHQTLATKRTLKRLTSPVQQTATKQRTLSKKQSQVTSKQIKSTSKSLKLAAKRGRELAEQNELRYIERLLDEDFVSLSQARRALKKEVIPAKKRVTKSLPKQLPKTLKSAKKTVLKTAENVISKVTTAIIKPFKQSQPHITVSKTEKSYTLRDLKDGDRRAIIDYLGDRLNANALDKALLNLGESWAARVSYRYTATDGIVKTGYANTHNIYDSAFKLFQRLSGYVEHAKISATQKAQWLNQIKIVKFGGSGEEWKAKKQVETAKQDTRRAKVSKILKKKGGK